MDAVVTIDIGNSRLSWGRFEGDRLRSRGHLTREECRAKGALAALRTRWGRVSSVGIASVESDLATRVADEWPEDLPAPRWFRGFADLPLSLAPAMRHPETIGIDRLLNVFAWVESRRALPALIVDVGTAITIDVADAEGRFAGGVILPGERLLARALVGGTAFLPEVVAEVSSGGSAIGTETRSAIARGIGGLVVGGVSHHLRRMARELTGRAFSAGGGSGSRSRRAPVVVATGGGAARWAPAIEEIERVVPALTLDGIRLALVRGAGG